MARVMRDEEHFRSLFLPDSNPLCRTTGLQMPMVVSFPEIRGILVFVIRDF